MTQYFECKAKYLKEAGNGLIRSVTTSYLVDAMTFTECEERLTKELADVLKEFRLMTCTRSKISEVVQTGDCAKWWKCKIAYSSCDEESGTEKKIATFLLVEAGTPESALERLTDHLSNMAVPYEVPGIVESKISEVMEYEANKTA